MAPEIRFVYFDLGNVLLDFSHQQAADQIAALSGMTGKQAFDTLFSDEFQWAYERGAISSHQLHTQFCAITKSQSELEHWLLAASSIFQPKLDVWQIVQDLAASGMPLGILSNTCEGHWDYCLQEYSPLFTHFAIHALSFRLLAMKPEPEIYHRAAKLASVPLQQILFIDDKPENVTGAASLGMDAILFEGSESLRQSLQQRKLL